MSLADFHRSLSHKERRERRRCYRSFIAIALTRASERRQWGQFYAARDYVQNAKRHRFALAGLDSFIPG